MIPDWLLPWWKWWADFTDLFNWEALAVIFAGIGGAWALQMWRMAQKDRRRLEGATIQIAVQPIGVVVKTLSFQFDKIRMGENAQQALRDWQETGVLKSQVAALDRVSIEAMPSILAVDLIAASKSCFDDLEKFTSAVISAQDQGVLNVAINSVIDTQRSLLAFAWKLEREAEHLAGSLQTYGSVTVADFEAEMAEHEMLKAKPLHGRVWHRVRKRFGIS